MQPLASICVPLRNKQRALRKTVRALLNQTYKPLEIVLSDNASDDGSTQIAQALAAANKQVRYHRLESVLGIAESWSYAMRLARGEFIHLHSADDPGLPPDFLEQMVAPLLRGPADFTVCPMVVKAEAGLDIPPEMWHEVFKKTEHLNRILCNTADQNQRARLLVTESAFQNQVGTPYGVVFRKHCLPPTKSQYPICWPSSYPDWDFNLRLFLHYRGEFVDSTHSLFHYDRHHAFAHISENALYLIMDAMSCLLMPLISYADPDLQPLRQQIAPTELREFKELVAQRLGKVYQTCETMFRQDNEHRNRHSPTP